MSHPEYRPTERTNISKAVRVDDGRKGRGKGELPAWVRKATNEDLLPQREVFWSKEEPELSPSEKFLLEQYERVIARIRSRLLKNEPPLVLKESRLHTLSLTNRKVPSQALLQKALNLEDEVVKLLGNESVRTRAETPEKQTSKAIHAGEQKTTTAAVAPSASIAELTVPKELIFSPEEQAMADEARAIIKRMGWNQYEAAKITGKTQPMISRLMNGTVRVTPSFLKLLRHEAGESHKNITPFHRELDKLLEAFPDSARPAASKMVLAFTKNLLEKFRK